MDRGWFNSAIIYADLVPLGLLRRIYPIVLWKSGRSKHGIVAVGELLHEQNGTLLYQLHKWDLSRIVVTEALNLSANKCSLARLIECLLNKGNKSNSNKIVSLLQYISDSQVHCEYILQYIWDKPQFFGPRP